MPLFNDLLTSLFWHCKLQFYDGTKKTPASGIEMPTLSIYEIDPARNHFSNRENCAIIYVNIIVKT